ncbi:MAG: hypothetical protein QXY45_02495 [Candidatus Aenigmatarchaeota archaeon]
MLVYEFKDQNTLGETLGRPLLEYLKNSGYNPKTASNIYISGRTFCRRIKVSKPLSREDIDLLRCHGITARRV